MHFPFFYSLIKSTTVQTLLYHKGPSSQSSPPPCTPKKCAMTECICVCSFAPFSRVKCVFCGDSSRYNGYERPALLPFILLQSDWQLQREKGVPGCASVTSNAAHSRHPLTRCRTKLATRCSSCGNVWIIWHDQLAQAGLSLADPQCSPVFLPGTLYRLRRLCLYVDACWSGRHLTNAVYRFCYNRIMISFYRAHNLRYIAERVFSH